jgi:hypothetical protein
MQNETCSYEVRCELPMEFFLTVDGIPGLTDEEVLGLACQEDFLAAVETIIGAQTNSDLLKRCIEAWANPSCTKTVF